ncbi:hypothetical protein [Rathayibacter tanaceti]|nr:hypothetical protein [Rathayibacter tanaceti]KZX20884.1 hypothetical protein ACH61_02002 [Rathayibacter tanaceti]TCO37981.1 hypothetical protein EV639_103168 [Rathayibacter tanaceti]
MLAEQGVETTVRHGENPEDVELVSADARRFALFTVLAKTLGAPIDEAETIIADHIGWLVSSADMPDLAGFSPEELRSRIRTRLLSSRDNQPDDFPFRYARPFSEGIVIALCIDLPGCVVALTDSAIGTLALGEDELYAFGQLNTDREPVDQRYEATPGIEVIVGDSLFTASKAANLPAVIGSAPFGTFFTVPSRHTLITLPLTGPQTLDAVSDLVTVTMRIIGDGLVPGGVMSLNVHFSRGGVVTTVSSIDESGTMTLRIDERLRQALEESAAIGEELGTADGPVDS